MITPEQLAEWRAALARKGHSLIRPGDFVMLLDVALPALLAEVTELQAQHIADAAHIRDLNITVSSEKDDNYSLRQQLDAARLEIARWRNAGVGA